MTYLIFDTETSGLPDYNLSLTDPKQPRILQLGFAICDESGREAHLHKIPIKPEGFEVDETGIAFRVNGLGNHYLNKYGVPMSEALAMFKAAAALTTMKVAHNYRFDGFLMKCEYERLGLDSGPIMERYCTMNGMKQTGRLTSVKLSECVRLATGKELEGAHDALADVRGCKDVFFWLKSNGLFQPQPRKEAA